MTRIHLATGLAIRDGKILLAASRYASHDLLWSMPGGRQRPNELLTETVARELAEETSLEARVGALAYVSESYDGDRHFTNVTFHIEVTGEPKLPDDDHVVAIEWVPIDEIATRIAAGVVREPLLNYLNERLPQRYAGFPAADVSVRWHDDEA